MRLHTIASAICTVILTGSLAGDALADTVIPGTTCQPAHGTTAFRYGEAGEIYNNMTGGTRTAVCPITHVNRNDNHFRARVDVLDEHDGAQITCTAVAKDLDSAYLYGQSTKSSGVSFVGSKGLVMNTLYADSTATYFVYCDVPGRDSSKVGGITVPYDEASSIVGILVWELYM